MQAVNIAELRDFKMKTSVDVVWVIAAPKRTTSAPLQRGRDAGCERTPGKGGGGGDLLTLCHEKGVFYFKSEKRTVLLTSFGVAPFTGAIPLP